MSDASNSTQRTSVLERHAQSGLQILIVALIGWFGVSVTATRETVARLDERLAAMERRFEELSAGRYSSADASRDQTWVQRQFADHEERLRRLERKPADGK